MMHYAKYRAKWPADLVLDSLPPAVTGVEYDHAVSTNPGYYVSITGGGKMSKIAMTAGGDLYFEEYDRCAQAIPPKADTVILGMPYAKGSIFLSSFEDTASIRRAGFSRLIRCKPQFDPSIEDVIRNPQLLKATKMKGPLVMEFLTCWPISLNTRSLPPSVLAVISDQLAIPKDRKRPQHHIQWLGN
jgi:hypothetical protein